MVNNLTIGCDYQRNVAHETGPVKTANDTTVTRSVDERERHPVVRCDPRQHDWRIHHYSAVRQGEDRPDTVFLMCAKCGEETMEDFA